MVRKCPSGFMDGKQEQDRDEKRPVILAKSLREIEGKGDGLRTTIPPVLKGIFISSSFF